MVSAPEFLLIFQGFPYLLRFHQFVNVPSEYSWSDPDPDPHPDPVL